MPSEDTKILGFNQYRKSGKASFVIYADLESLIEKINGCKNDSEKLSTTKVSEHILSSCSMSTISSFKGIENENHVYRGEEYTNKFCESLRFYQVKMINMNILQVKKYYILIKAEL